jgi:putative ATP-binding cassette transporter
MIKLVLFFIRSAKSIQFSKGIVFAVVLASIIGGASNTAMVALINHALGMHGKPVSLIVAFAGLCVLQAISKFLSQVLLIRFASSTIAELRFKISQRIVSSPLRHLEEIGPHRLLAAITEDIPMIMAALTQGPSLCINSVIVAGCLVYMGWLSWRLLLLVTVSLLIGMAGYHFLEQRSKNLFRLARNEANVLLKDFRALLDGAKELQMHRKRRHEFLTESIGARANRVAGYRVSATTNYAVAQEWGELMIFVVIGLLIFLFSEFKGANTQVLTGYVLVFFYMTTPLQFILNSFPAVSQADIAVDRIEKMDLLLRSRQIQDSDKAVLRIPAEWRCIELNGVTHSYHREKENSSFTLGPIDLRIEPGELIFITGGNGSGKTTLVKLLTGLYSPESGDVYLNEDRVTDESRDAYRHLFSAVFSDFFLFDELHGMRDLDDKANAYLSYFQLDHKVKVQNGVLSTTELSQGQRKRLALLVAYLEDRPIFVFDEWAADQDPVFREIFYYQLLPELKQRGKAVIVVSHDDRYYRIADRIIKLDYGKLEEDFVHVAEGGQAGQSA